MKTPSSHLVRAIAAVGLILAAGASTAYAAMNATVLTDLNVRAGPGPQYPVVTVLKGGSTAVLDGCVAGSNWCRVDVGDVSGWAYGSYLTTDLGGSTVVISERHADLAIPVVSYETTGSTVVTTTPPERLELIGPVESIEPIAPPPMVRSYISANPVEPVYLEGDLVVGATLPGAVTVQPIPDYDYEYLVINDQPVLVEPATRRIVHVYR